MSCTRSPDGIPFWISRPHQLPNPETCPLEELEQAMDCGPDGKAFRRLNTIHLLLVGASYEVALRNTRVKERTLRLWISRFNQRGIEGLSYRPYTGRPRRMDPAQVSSDILTVVDDPSLSNQTHWTLTKLCGSLRKEKQIDLSYRTLVRYPRERAPGGAHARQRELAQKQELELASYRSGLPSRVLVRTSTRSNGCGSISRATIWRAT